MPYCKNCGEEVDLDVRACPFCGARIVEKDEDFDNYDEDSDDYDEKRFFDDDDDDDDYEDFDDDDDYGDYDDDEEEDEN